MQINIQFADLFVDSGTFDITSNIGLVSPSTATVEELLVGIIVNVSDLTTIITVSSDFCDNNYIIILDDTSFDGGDLDPLLTTTTTTTIAGTTTTTEEQTTTSTTLVDTTTSTLEKTTTTSTTLEETTSTTTSSTSTSSSTTTTTTTIPTTTTTTTIYNTCINYGLLYNWYAIEDARGLTKENAHVPTKDEWVSLRDFLGGTLIAGGKIMELGYTHWSCSVAGRTNSTRLSIIGSGMRNHGDGFFFLNMYSYYWTATASIYANQAFWINFNCSGNWLGVNIYTMNSGCAIRLIVDTPDEIIDDDNAIYIGNNGISYYCVKINGVWWTTENLIETRFRNGDLIPKITNNTLWVNTDTTRFAAMCAYNNAWGYVGCISEPPDYTTTTTSTTSTTVEETTSTTTTTTTTTIP